MTEHQNARIGVYGGDRNEVTNDGLDRFERLQEPDFAPVDDLTRFVKARIIEAETEPRGEVLALYDEPAGAMAHRYAGYVRRDMVAFRRITLRHCVHGDLYDAVRAIALRWADHRDFKPEWQFSDW